MIDTSAWTKFKIEDLFIVSRGQRHVVGNHEDGNLPYYSASLDNNGVTDYISNPLFVDNDALVVTTFGDAFYAKGDFTASDEITILHHEKMNELSGLFIASAIRQNKWKYSFKVKAFKERVSNDSISLPATSDGQPDWDYMESYMKAVMEESEKSLENLKKADNTKHLIDVSGWGEFRIGDLFDVSRPASRSSRNYDEGDMPFVASGNFNNGVTAYLKPKDDNDYDECGCITVSAVDGYAFYQEDKFLGRGGAGSSIMMLRNDNLNELNGKYICTLIRKACSDWEYSNMGNKDKLVDTMIWLPTTSIGEPDWQYMEDYMKQIMDKSEQILSDLQIGA